MIPRRARYPMTEGLEAIGLAEMAALLGNL